MTVENDGEVRWGILGAGDVCEVKSAPAMQRVPGSRIAAVMRRDGGKAADYARRHGVPAWYDDADALLADPAVNAVYVATPPGAHCELTLRAAAAGKPVYVEKPMARTFDECRRMQAACDAAGVPLFVAYYRRALPQFVAIRNLLAAGRIGDVRHVRIDMNQAPTPAIVRKTETDWRVDPAISGGGYFHDLASHQFDLLDFLLGPVADAKGFSRNQVGAYAADDIVTAAFSFESGVLGSGSWCFTASDASAIDRTTIVGSAGEIRYATFGDGRFEVETDAAGTEELEYPVPAHIQEPLIASVVDALLGRGDCPSTGTSGARASLVMDRICQD